MRKFVAPLAITGSLVTGGIAGALLGVPALSGAQTDSGSTSTENTTGARPPGPIETALSKLVAEDTITQAQADAVREALKAEMGDRPFGRHGRHKGPRVELDAAATALGLTPAELRSELQAGKTIAQVATAKSVDLDTVINALVESATKRIDQAVTNGKLDAARADDIKAGLKDKITTMVNNLPRRPHGPGGDGPFGRGPGDGAEPVASSTDA